MPTEYITAAVAASLLGVTRQRVYALVAAGDIAIVRIGQTRIAFEKTEVERYIAETRKPGYASIRTKTE